MSTTDSKAKNIEKPPYKKTDYRYEAWVKERKALRARAKKSSYRVDLGPQPKTKTSVTVDTSRARSTLDVVRLCLKELGWREVWLFKKNKLKSFRKTCLNKLRSGWSTANHRTREEILQYGSIHLSVIQAGNLYIPWSEGNMRLYLRPRWILQTEV